MMAEESAPLYSSKAAPSAVYGAIIPREFRLFPALCGFQVRVFPAEAAKKLPAAAVFRREKAEFKSIPTQQRIGTQ